MDRRYLTGLDFEAWIEHVFSHAVPFNGGGVEWYFEMDADRWDGPASLTIAHLTRLFENPEPALACFADSQIAQGLYYIVDSGAGGLVLSILDEAVDWPSRHRCVVAIGPLFERLLAPRVAPVLGHLDEQGTKPLNMVTYMWWGILPVAAKAEPARPPDPLNAAILEVMARILKSTNPAIQESALHGLGHSASAHGQEVARIIDAYTASGLVTRKELLAYAKATRSGCVL